MNSEIYAVDMQQQNLLGQISLMKDILKRKYQKLKRIKIQTQVMKLILLI